MDKPVFEIDWKVTINLTGVAGSVVGIYIGRKSTTYNVEYADANNVVHTGYFDEDQLTAA